MGTSRALVYEVTFSADVTPITMASFGCDSVTNSPDATPSHKYTPLHTLRPFNLLRVRRPSQLRGINGLSEGIMRPYVLVANFPIHGRRSLRRHMLVRRQYTPFFFLVGR